LLQRSCGQSYKGREMTLNGYLIEFKLSVENTLIE